MAGYVRQSAADIVPTAVVRAAPINNELNALRDAFAQATGHKHDGTAAEGHYIPVIGDTDAKNKIAVDTTNNRHGVFVEVSGTSTEQVRFQDGAVVPVTDNDIDLGTNSLEFKDLYIDGTANIDSLIADTVDINAGTIDNTVVGATTPAAATVTNLTVNTAAVIASADINAGTIDGAVIGSASAQAITGTTITATTGFVGGLTGAVTGNTTGTHTGPVVGNVTGDLTGNVTASSGSSSFNDVAINGSLNMNAGTTATIINLTAPTNAGDAATKGYVDTSISALLDSAPGALDTLNELAAALGDDANFATTVTNEIATKVSKSGDTMSGVLAMGANKITGVGNPTSNQDAATKAYVDNANALKLNLAGGTMSGAIAMGTNKITGLGTPTDNADATTKVYVDGILGSATSAAASAAAAAVSASNASTSETNASNSASSASASAAAAAASFDSFDDRYLGAKASAPTVDNDGNTLLVGAQYWNSTSNQLFLWTGSVWSQATLTAGSFATLTGNETLTNKTINGSNNTITNVSLTTGVTDILPVANGGTGNTTAQAEMNRVAQAVTSGQYLRGNGTNVVMSAIQVADVPTLNQNTTGTAANVTGTVAIINGGTGQTTRQAAMDALAGAVTAGQYLRGDGTDVVMSAIQAADVPTLNQNTTGTAANVTGIVAAANGGTGQNTLTGLVLPQPVITQNIQVISGNTTAVRSRTYVMTASLTLTLPASPTAGDMVMFSNNSGTTTPVIGRNGQNIEGLAEDMTVDNVNYFGTLVFADATRGWIFQ